MVGGTEASSIRQFTLTFNDLDDTTVTEIGTIDAGGNLNVGVIYDLQGRRITQPQRGHIYIVGGRKVRY